MRSRALYVSSWKNPSFRLLYFYNDESAHPLPIGIKIRFVLGWAGSFKSPVVIGLDFVGIIENPIPLSFPSDLQISHKGLAKIKYKNNRRSCGEKLKNYE